MNNAFGIFVASDIPVCKVALVSGGLFRDNVPKKKIAETILIALVKNWTVDCVKKYHLLWDDNIFEECLNALKQDISD